MEDMEEQIENETYDSMFKVKGEHFKSFIWESLFSKFLGNLHLLCWCSWLFICGFCFNWILLHIVCFLVTNRFQSNQAHRQLSKNGRSLIERWILFKIRFVFPNELLGCMPNFLLQIIGHCQGKNQSYFNKNCQTPSDLY